METISTCVGYINSHQKRFQHRNNHYTVHICSNLGWVVNNMHIIFTTHNTNRIINPKTTKYSLRIEPAESGLNATRVPETNSDPIIMSQSQIRIMLLSVYTNRIRNVEKPLELDYRLKSKPL